MRQGRSLLGGRMHMAVQKQENTGLWGGTEGGKRRGEEGGGPGQVVPSRTTGS